MNFTFNMIDIEIANKTSDFLKIAQLAQTIWRDHYIPIIGEPQVAYMLDKFQSVRAMEKQIVNGFEYFILNFEKTPVGYMAIHQHPETLFLSKLYVLSHYRGKGIAKAALECVEENAKNRSLKSIKLTVNKNNVNSIKVYEKLGFVNTTSIQIDIGNGFVMDDYEMVKVF